VHGNEPMAECVIHQCCTNYWWRHNHCFLVHAMFIQCVSSCVRADTVTEHCRASKYNSCTLAPEDCSDDGVESLGDAKRCDWESSAVTC
jgi:hypothetical protein